MGDHGHSSNNTASIYNLFKDNFTRPHEYGELIVHDALRELHPGQHITVVKDAEANLFAYADAGHAEAELLQDDDDFLALRSYAAPTTRMEGGDGKLSDRIRFGMYNYRHQGSTFSILRAEWYQNYSYDQRQKMNFILSPKPSLGEERQPKAVDQLLTAAGKWTAQLHDEVYVFDQGNWFKDKSLWTAVQTATWDDVILDPEMKSNIIQDVEGFFASRSIYEEYSVPWKRGLIFHGTPGCGKTISIKALMNALQRQDVVSLYVKTLSACQGEEYSIRAIFAMARKMAPCMLIFEDLDSLVADKVRSYFLNEVDGLERNDGILMVGSTNHLEKLDPAISKRPSRFDRKYHFRLPSEQERVAYCIYWRKKLERNSSIQYHEDIALILAQLTEGFSFAYLKELFVQTLLSIVGGRADADEEDEEEEEYDHIAEAVKDSAAFDTVTGTDTAKNDDNITTLQPKPAPRELPSVTIPAHLQTNTLMRVLHKQVKVLWREMDNTTGSGDEIHEKPKVGRSMRAAKRADRLRFVRGQVQAVPA